MFLSVETWKLAFVVLILVVEFIIRLAVEICLYLFPFPRTIRFLRRKFRSAVVKFSTRWECCRDDPALNYTTRELLALEGVGLEDHIAETEDGFYIVLHRFTPFPSSRPRPLRRRTSSTDRSSSNSISEFDEAITQYHTRRSPVVDELRKTQDKHNRTNVEENGENRGNESAVAAEYPNGVGRPSRPAVLMMHGLMMSSEVFVCNARLSLAIHLYKQGYDVWLANNRGNKYSWRHRRLKRNNLRYWDFSIDEFARFDVPASVALVLKVTGRKEIGYIGFSNGTAQMFAALSSNKELNSQVAVFVALAPTCKLQTLNPRADESVTLLYPLMTSSRRFFYLIFGRCSILSTADTWKRWLSAANFMRVLDVCLWILFSWSPQHSSFEEKLMFYSHIYSTTSSKVVHHWFQMLRSGRFEYYNSNAGLGLPGDVVVPEYEIGNIVTPIVMLHGGCDRLSNIGWLKKHIRNCESTEIPHYEHIDFLIAQDVSGEVFPRVMRALKTYLPIQPDDANSSR